MIAAEKTGRKARLIELDPRYVDATIKRWETFTGARAIKADVADWNAEVDRELRDDETATNDAHASQGEGGAS